MQDFSGGCLCNSVSYTCRVMPNLIINCHCSDCRKALGSVHGTMLFVPEEAVTIQGYPRSFSHAADSGALMTKMFCEQCGSQVFSKNTNRPGVLGIRAGSVDDASIIRPQMNVFVEKAVPSTAMDPALPQHRRMPG